LRAGLVKPALFLIYRCVLVPRWKAASLFRAKRVEGGPSPGRALDAGVAKRSAV